MARVLPPPYPVYVRLGLPRDCRHGVVIGLSPGTPSWTLEEAVMRDDVAEGGGDTGELCRDRPGGNETRLVVGVRWGGGGGG